MRYKIIPSKRFEKDMKRCQKREAAMLFVKNLSVRGGQPVPADERGIDALVNEKYDKR
jgi:hypothetical protein